MGSKIYTAESLKDANRSRVADFIELTKPRLSSMSVISALFGYFVAPVAKDFATLGFLFIGTALTAAGAAALNQWMEHRSDAAMPRTADRPIPRGSIKPFEAFVFGNSLCVLGLVALFAGTNAIAGALILLTLGLYLFIYTPMKKLSPLNTHIGAIPGALPPLVGWVSATGSFDLMGWILFAVLFAWQMPHFMAISWMYRDDYIRGGYRMLSREDATGRRVAAQALAFSIILAALTVVPIFTHDANYFYAASMVVLNGILIALSVKFLRAASREVPAKKLFYYTLIYLPLYLLLLVLGLNLA